MTLPPRPRPDFGPRAGFPASLSPPVPAARPASAPAPTAAPGRPKGTGSPNWIPDRPAAPPREGVALADALRLANPRMPTARPAPPATGDGTTAAAAPAQNLGELSQVYNRARVLAARRQTLSDWLGPVLGPRVRLSNVRSGVAVVFVDSASLAVALRRKHADIVAFLVARGTSVTKLDIRIAPAPGQGTSQHATGRSRGAPARPFG